MNSETVTSSDISVQGPSHPIGKTSRWGTCVSRQPKKISGADCPKVSSRFLGVHVYLTLTKTCTFSLLLTLFPLMPLSHSHTPRLCSPGMLIVTLTVQPYSRLIHRPSTVCFSWRARLRESSVSEWRWNTGQFNSTYAPITAHHQTGPCINSVLICWHTKACPEIPPKLSPLRFSCSHTHVNLLLRTRQPLRPPRSPAFVWMSSPLVMLPAGDRYDVMVLR